MRLVQSSIVIAAAAMLAACASPPPRQPAHCEKEWAPATAIVLRYADQDGNVTRSGMEAGLRKDFDAADINHDGVLDAKEVRAVNEARWQADRSASSPLVDWNGTGTVDFDSFAATARSLFAELDAKNTGVLKAAELRQRCGGEPGQNEREPPSRGGRRGRGQGSPDDGKQWQGFSSWSRVPG